MNMTIEGMEAFTRTGFGLFTCGVRILAINVNGLASDVIPQKPAAILGWPC